MDDVDFSQQKADAELTRLISRRVVYDGESAEDCDECGDEIPEKRRAAIPGVLLCVACAQVTEARNRHNTHRN